MSILLDGFAAGLDVTIHQTLGKSGKKLRHWLFAGKIEIDSQIISTIFENSGAVWIMGAANLSQSLINAGLLDEMQVHIPPILMGNGIRLFENIGNKHIELERNGRFPLSNTFIFSRIKIVSADIGSWKPALSQLIAKTWIS